MHEPGFSKDDSCHLGGEPDLLAIWMMDALEETLESWRTTTGSLHLNDTALRSTHVVQDNRRIGSNAG